LGCVGGVRSETQVAFDLGKEFLPFHAGEGGGLGGQQFLEGLAGGGEVFYGDEAPGGSEAGGSEWDESGRVEDG
jgi:hypothetical protein